MKEPFQILEGLQETATFPAEVAGKIITARAEVWITKTVGCSRREIWVLMCVNGNQLNQKQISSALLLHPTTVVELIDGLERRKLVKRVSPKGNRKQNIIELTDKGREMTEAALSRQQEALREIFSPLAEEDVLRFRALSLTIASSRDRVRLDN
jgi:DNA-binding MarR family transcriptional regulator